MTIQRTFYCDGPDCERSATTARTRHPLILTVTGNGEHLHFCGWDCVLRYAGTKEPEEVIEAE